MNNNTEHPLFQEILQPGFADYGLLGPFFLALVCLVFLVLLFLHALPQLQRGPTYESVRGYILARPGLLVGLSLLLLLQSLAGYLALPGRLVASGYAPMAALSMAGPLVFTGLALLILNRSRHTVARLSLAGLTSLHLFRLFIEGVMFMNLYEQGGIPREMTILGRNPDLLVGLTALPVAFLWWRKWMGPRLLILWNLLGLACLINIVSVAILSMPTDFQLFGLDQPNVAILRFPFMLLPAFLVPVAFLAHVYSLCQLWPLARGRKEGSTEPELQNDVQAGEKGG
ncbi:MAG: hypothetical protein KDK25_13120 [Leptospiraceae bacterium]|nr:hypothetical protein [Leptospiraceae bacterium]